MSSKYVNSSELLEILNLIISRWQACFTYLILAKVAENVEVKTSFQSNFLIKCGDGAMV